MNIKRFVLTILATFLIGAQSIAYAPSQVFVATAYSLRGRTASGVMVRPGIVAADPRVLPLHSRVHVDAPGSALDGEYLVADTGRKIKQKRIDIWLSSNRAAMRFGVRKVRLTVLSYGNSKSKRR